MKNIIQSLLRLSITQDHVQTANYMIYPQYDYMEGTQQFKGYEVTYMLSIRIENIDQTGKVIDTVVHHGVNRIIAVTITVKNRDIYYRHAIKMAVENAFYKAKSIAYTMRVNLEAVPFKVVELLNEQPRLTNHQLAITEVSGVSTPIEPGQINIEANVKVDINYY